MNVPWTQAQEARIVEQAVRFIRECERRHSREFALEVGEHLFNGLFKGSVELYRAKGAWGRDSLLRISGDGRVEISLDRLYMCIHCYILSREYGGRVPDSQVPDLSPWKWDRLWVLEADPGALVAVADWAEREKISLSFLLVVARVVEPYVKAGGRIDDLLVSEGGTPYGRMVRLLEVVERWVTDDAVKYPAELRARMIRQIDLMLAATGA